MRIEHIDDRLLVKYLLGNLSETEEAQVEDRAFAEADYLGALEAAEADLIDTYVRGGLSQSERRAFERRFLTAPNRRNKVEFAKVLAKVTAESSQPELQAPRQTLIGLIRGWSPALRFATAVATLICVAGTSWLIFQNAAMQSRMVVLESQRRDLEAREQGLQRQLSEEQNRAAVAAAQLRQPQSSGGAPRVAALFLLPGLSRAETQVEQLVLTPTTQLARIEIQLEARDDYQRFRADLHTRRGDEILTLGNLPRRRTNAGYTVSFEVPASALAAGDYELALKGLADHQTAVDIGYYYFRVRTQ